MSKATVQQAVVAILALWLPASCVCIYDLRASKAQVELQLQGCEATLSEVRWKEQSDETVCSGQQ